MLAPCVEKVLLLKTVVVAFSNVMNQLLDYHWLDMALEVLGEECDCRCHGSCVSLAVAPQMFTLSSELKVMSLIYTAGLRFSQTM